MKYFKAYAILLLILFIAGKDYLDALFVLPIFLTLWLKKPQVLSKVTDK